LVVSFSQVPRPQNQGEERAIISLFFKNFFQNFLFLKMLLCSQKRN